jgi:CBS domain-containing protein
VETPKLRASKRTLLEVRGPTLAYANPMIESNPHEVPITKIMTRASITAPGDATVESLTAIMTEHHVGCVPIVDSQERPIGIVTKLDLIECRDTTRKTARDVMMPHAMALQLSNSLAEASDLMSREGFHHLLVLDGERLAGVVSTFDVTRWVAGLSAAPR